MKNIIIFTVNYVPWISGAELFVKEVVARLRGEYHFVVITARTSRRVPRHETKDGVEIVRVGLGSKFDKWCYPILAPVAVWRRPHELVHAVMESYAGIALWIYKIFCRRPTMLTLQSGDLDDKAASGKIPSWIWKRIHTNPDFITAISTFLADRAKRLRGSDKNVVVVPNGVDLELVNHLRSAALYGPLAERGNPPAGGPRATRIICVARLSPEKGLEYLLRAMPAVRSAIPDAELALVGGGALETPLKTLARELGIESAVTFLGAQPHEEVIKEILKSDVFVCPSLAEGLGIVFIEAQACGVPVVGTRVGGIPDVIEDRKTGLLVPSKDPQALAAALIELLDSPGLRKDLAHEALRRIDRYSWDGIAKEVGLLYQRLCSGGLQSSIGDGSLKTSATLHKNGRIVFAAGLYPPAVGGPATVARDLVEQFHGIGHGTAVVHYGAGGVPQTGSVVARYFRFARAVVRAARGADAILAFDAVGSGIPAAIASVFSRKPLAIRVGGDYFWEHASERANEVLTLRKYWERGPSHVNLSYWLIRFALARARMVIFNSEMLSSAYVRHGLVLPSKVVVIPNAVPSFVPMGPKVGMERSARFLFAGRFIKLKNIPRLLEAVKKIGVSLTLVGSGPLENEIREMVRALGLESLVTILPPKTSPELQDLIRASAAVVIPSYSEVSPQLVGEALSLETPVIITREHGLSEALRQHLFEIDPTSAEDLVAKMKSVLSSFTVSEWQKRLRERYQPRRLEMVAKEYGDVVKGLILIDKGRQGWKRIMKTVLYGLASVQALWYRGPRVAIFLYHDIGYNRLYLTVRPEALLSQIRALRRWGFKILSLHEVVQALKDRAPLPRKTAVLTFDDGTLGQYEHAFRICREEGVPATFFITTGWIGRECEFSQGKVPALRLEHIEEMRKTPDIAIEPHGVTHRHFDQITDDEVRREVLESKRDLGGTIFAYPSGKFAERHKKIIVEAGLDAAVTVDQGLVNDQDLFALPRITIDRGLSTAGLFAATVPWGIKLLKFLRT